MTRSFQFGEDPSGDIGLQAMLTDEGTILNTQSAAGEAVVIEENVATTVENPNFKQEPSPQLDYTNTLTLSI